jgi:pimeloyl-ACP methyl ester carboxylesterase
MAGTGLPPVVIDAGIGSTAEDWQGLQSRIASRTTVIIYDRAGYGSSEAGPLPRDSGTEADELRTLLTALSVPAPYVMVGHSLGGLNLQVYAGRYPDDVAGLVLLDPPPLSWLLGKGYPELRALAEQMTADWQEIADRGLTAADRQAKREAIFFQMLASEHREMLGASAQLAAGVKELGDVPLTVIASGVPNPRFGVVAADYQHYWIEQNRILAKRSTRGSFVLAEESTHHLHVEAADLVVESIFSVLAQVGRQE